MPVAQNSRQGSQQNRRLDSNRNRSQQNRNEAANNPFGVTQDKFWNLIPATATKPPELLLYGSISSQQSWWEDRVTPEKFNQELAELGEDVPEIVVRINSGGGDVFAANAIYTRLKDHPAKITVKIDGWAASAATIIAMAGDIIRIARNGVFMIHDPAMTVWDTFKAEEFEKMAEELKVIKQSIINTYAMRTGRDEKEISAFMSEEKWWTGDAAVENGFCDELMFEESKTVVENSNRIIVNSTPINISQFQTIPKALLGNPVNLDITGCKKQPENKNPKEENEMEPKDIITTVEALKAAYPDLIDEIENNAKAEERNRIKAIKDADIGGFESIVEDAMFTNPISAEGMALKILNAQKKQGGTYLAGRREDAEDSGVNGVGAGASERGTETADPYNEAIDRLFSETK